MAKITAGIPFTPHIIPASSSKIKLSYSSLSSSESKACGHVFPNNSIGFLPSSTYLYRVCAFVSARYGGVPRSSGPGDPRRPDEEQAFDISSIRSDTVRLIDAQQNMVGIVSKVEAIKMAEDAELDLVILSPDADPPVLRIMDYNKYRYELQKKKREQQKKSAASRMDLKELKMGYNIDQHDYSVRLKAARKFLKDGDKVKVIVNLKGRENEFRSIAIKLITRFQNDIGELATEEARNFRDRNIFIVLVPNKAVIQKAQEPSKRKDKSPEMKSLPECELSSRLQTSFRRKVGGNSSFDIPHSVVT